MATTPQNPAPPPVGQTEAGKARLSKEERRELLARIERESSRSESPERILQRAEQALQSGNRTHAERLAAQLRQKSPNLLGLENLTQRLAAASRDEKQQANVRKAEDMLMRYIEERKKPAAEFALEALTEIAPEHPRLGEYRIWVRDLDKEAAAAQELDGELAAGRMALQVGDVNVATRHLEKLRQLDPHAAATSQLAADIAEAEHDQAEDADIEGIKLRFEEHLLALRIPEAQEELADLARHEVPKITLDRLNVRLQEAQSVRRDQQEMAAFEELYQQYVKAHRWQKARDVAQQAGKRFPNHPRPAEMFNNVSVQEAADRHQESVRQGVATLEQFISQGQRDQAQLALKLLKGKIDDAQLAQFEERVRAL